MKFILLIAVIYLAYRLFFQRPGVGSPADRPTVDHHADSRNHDDDYIDYEEVK